MSKNICRLNFVLDLLIVSTLQSMVVRSSGEKASGIRSSAHQGEEETEGPEASSWIPQPRRGSGILAARCGPIRQLLQLGTPSTRHDQRISFLPVSLVFEC